MTDPVIRIRVRCRGAVQGVGIAGWGALLAGGALLGWLGSFIVATRELREIEPK